MNASVSSSSGFTSRGSSGPSGPDASGARGAVDTSVTVAGYAVLLLLGFTAGIVCSLASGWLSWLWGTGTWGMLLAGVALVVFLGALHAGCRAAGWAMGSRLGAGLPALGWVAAGLTFTFVGDIQLVASVFSGVFHVGAVVAVVFATLMSDPPGKAVTPASRPGSSR